MKKASVFFMVLFMTAFVQASPNTWLGPTGLFSIIDSKTLEQYQFAGSFYFNNIDREIDRYQLDPLSFDYSYLTLPLAFGITDRFEISVAPSYLNLRISEIGTEDGFGDIYVNVKASLFEQEDVWGLAAVAYGKLPTADEDKGLGTGETDYGATLAASRYFEKTGIHLNLGYRIVGDPEGVDFDDQFLYGIGLERDLTDRLKLIGELTGETAYHPMASDDPLDALAGFRYAFDNGLNLGGGVRYAFNMEEQDCPVGGIVQIGFALGKPKPTPTPPPPPPPLMLVCQVESAKIFQNEAVRIRVIVSNTLNETITYNWTSTGCKLEPNEMEALFIAEDCDPGEYEVTCTVVSSEGRTASCAVVIQVMEKPPEKQKVQLDLPVVPFKKGTRVDNVAKAILDDIAVEIKKYPGVKITLLGHTDTTGSEEENVKIGMKRAENVKTYLVERHGIEADRFDVQSAGETKPMMDNDSPEGRVKNRRVEVIMIVEK
ncbi:OmpA family protein [bacterium]|nr:OmpA family protein [candidate division CSSED10-310 bacterium]